MKDQSFRAVFQTLTENDPFPWQEELFLRLVTGELPRHCDVPTGLGKTSVIAVWLAALGVSILEPARYRRIPRRLAYVVDRRVVVDQATDEVERLRERLARAGEDESLIALRPIADALMQATTVPDDCGVTVSTLRGKFADNHAWNLDPSRPAIIVGTVDMIGSRMLFSGYGGVGRNWRSLQAGLLLRDTWVVLDESHLVPSFESLLTGMELHAKCGISMCPFGITRMSATLATYHSDAESEIATTEKPLFGHTDMGDSRVAKRLNAPKSLRFVLVEAAVSASNPAEKRAAMAEKMAREAIMLADGRSAVVVFADTVDLVKAVTVAIEKHISKEWSKWVLMLTGEMRGFERDKLTTNEVLAAFSPKRDRSGATTPAFLVATACLEVGMDFDADHAVCDAVALERMIQRFGRVNRRGEVNAKIHLVLSAEVAAPTVGKIATIAPADASILTLRQLPASDDAFDASPAALRALDFTSPLARRAFSPPPVSPPLDEARLDDWSLTSLRSDEFPRPQVSYWLRGVTEDESMTTSLVWRADLCIAASREDAAEMMDTIPVSQNEVAQVATHRAAALLSALAKKNANALLVIRSASGESRGTEMGEFEDAGKRLGELVSATVFLPSGVGGMLKDIPDSSPEALKEPVADVINEAAWRRAVFTLAEHTRVTEAVARTLGERLGLAADLREAITLAARWHDRGKDRRWWQAAIGNTTGEPLAKSGQPYFDHSYNAGYRHEFGSLIEARDDETLHDHPQRELILHLIAAHHGHARPSFPAEAYDRTVPTTECAAIAAEVPRRFVALQQHYGWWTLAWLEALVKCADAIASAHPDWTAK